MSFRYKVEIWYDLGDPERGPNPKCNLYVVKASSPKQALPRLRNQIRNCGQAASATSLKIKDVEKVTGEELDEVLFFEKEQGPREEWF